MKLNHFRFLLLPLAFFILIWPSQGTGGEKHETHGPKAIYIIRHGEKPDDKDDPHLSAKGVERAKALVHVIPEHFVTPDFIWATAASRHSTRPLETVEPLAKSLKMEVKHEYADADFEKLAHELLSDSQYSGKNVLVCWHHGEIPGLAKALGAKDAPVEWKSDVFDRVWVISFADDKVEFQDLPQRALPGDAEK